MEVTKAVLPKRKAITKGKLKKTIKNVLCRSDPVFWPVLPEDKGKELQNIISNYKVDLPEHTKLQWQELKSIPKSKRPKPPKFKRVEGTMFGISECSASVQNGDCSAVILESLVNPQTIVHGVLDTCRKQSVPVVCIKGLRNCCSESFGIPTSCLGINKGCLEDITSKVIQFAVKFKNETAYAKSGLTVAENLELSEKPMDTDMVISSPYLHRIDKKTRVFVPLSNRDISTVRKEFIGQDFIEFSEKPNLQSGRTIYKKMIVKRISNNSNRKKVK